MSVTKILAGLCLVAIILPASAEEKFKVCADPLNPPYSTKNRDGFENKIAELFARELGQKVEYTWFAQRIGFIRNTLTAPVNEWDADSDEYKCDIVMGVPAGYDLTLTTAPYYKSTYVLLIAKGRGWDDIKDAAQLTGLPLQRQEALKIAMFDRGPGTTWLQQNGLLEQGIPYQSMSGDSENNTAMQIDKDLKAKKIDMVILWGPMAAYVSAQSPKNSYTMIPMKSTPGIKFDFAMAMGVRNGDKARKSVLDKLIATKADKIQAIIAGYNIPLLPITKEAVRDDD
ncbi:MAG: quinoprotein dehydrogenase-associated putative ABC transporter substrate-binding protein [Methylococcaceae bacterium]|jgi:quinoprotein dehydrogenase-associated probable ABC transporter substrate-binding protein|nr:quinoprotein dehydrogenase-associated putative ABC transporter substrate-binding protein [Methylococcaceae bacterium]MDD1631548.1 quinoprotein dehydrogenase-associated putative ABC transporter substrate-binding protein [Methylococcaceae bacterium]MDD1636974.1 quinoprotein dehydrogenase-associated putative ABC transporter substrate-binding protein [Methylococcaceae bacterium]MDD1643496.1 quinoprotein dehydrogenase-associated putative ABC transporter substrate-binding protein [Methylococcaceae 